MSKLGRDRAYRHLESLLGDGTVGHLSDGELLARFVTRGDGTGEMAFEVLLERHGPMVLRVCRAILRDTHDANDAFQATFLILVRRARSLWVRDSLGPWLQRISHRTALRVKRDQARRQEREREASRRSPLRGEDHHSPELAEVIFSEVARLPDRYRSTIVLCLMEGLTDEQAARQLGVPVGTVHSRLARGRAQLRSRLHIRGIAPSLVGLKLGNLTKWFLPAAVPHDLLHNTAALASKLVANGPTAARLLSPVAVTLAEGVPGMLSLTKIKIGLSVMLGGCFLAMASSMGSSFTMATPREPSSPDAALFASRQPGIAPKVRDPKADPAEAIVSPSTPHEDEAKRPPLQSTVAIKILDGGVNRIQSGTIITSSRQDSLILTSADSYQDDNKPVSVNHANQTFTTFAKLINYTESGSHVTWRENEEYGMRTEILDLDFPSNLALLRVRPGFRLPFSSPVGEKQQQDQDRLIRDFSPISTNPTTGRKPFYP